MHVQGGTVEACLDRQHTTLLSAALSVPLTLLHSILHDIAASLAFRAACSSATALATSTSSSWRGALCSSSNVSQTEHGLRVEFWTDCALLLPEGCALPTAAAGGRRGAVAVEVGIRNGALVVVTDPPLQQLWKDAAVMEAAQVAVPPNPRLDLESGDLDAVLSVRPLLDLPAIFMGLLVFAQAV
jgi:hypothetical protein